MLTLHMISSGKHRGRAMWFVHATHKCMLTQQSLHRAVLSELFSAIGALPTWERGASGAPFVRRR